MGGGVLRTRIKFCLLRYVKLLGPIESLRKVFVWTINLDKYLTNHSKSDEMIVFGQKTPTIRGLTDIMFGLNKSVNIQHNINLTITITALTIIKKRTIQYVQIENAKNIMAQ